MRFKDTVSSLEAWIYPGAASNTGQCLTVGSITTFFNKVGYFFIGKFFCDFQIKHISMATKKIL